MQPLFEKNYSKEGFSVSHRIGAETNERVIHALHSHLTYEIIYYMAGEASFQIEAESYNSSPGDLILINRQAFHRIFNLSEKYERAVIQIDCRLGSLFGNDINLFKFFSNASKAGSCIIRKEIIEKNNLDTRIKYLLELCADDNPENSLRLACNLMLLLLDIGTLIDNTTEPQNKPVDKFINGAIEYISGNLHSDFSLGDIAKSIYISKFYLCRLFKEKTGISIKSYIQIKRVYEAHSLITQGEPSGSASLKVGFNNYSNFYKAYKKIIGRNPKSYQ